ncbi:F-box domain protein [Apiospora rasikravindrae]|uniref:F-box domain protein n=1 Tax=Apiospora rasikravindrae TaxID=990691 RepID=A0ABR1SYE2_9PEZI
MANETAQQALLLGIPELLEAILLNLDQRDLLVNAQRVCRQWHQCIRDTPSIQQHLFFLPEPHSNTAATSADADAVPALRQNPLLARHFPEWFEHDEVWSADQRLPFIRTTEPGIRGLDRDRAYAYPRASWRRMLLQQPPRNGIGFVMTHCGRVLSEDPQPQRHFAEVYDGRPVTMPEFLQLTNTGLVIRPGPRPDAFLETSAVIEQIQRPRLQELRVAVSRFRVMWGRLSPEVCPSGEDGPPRGLPGLTASNG